MRRRGFTLVEALVVIGIIAIVMALLLPAVQQAREAARRAGCKNHLKQIGLALQNYYQTYSLFPPSTIARGQCFFGFGNPQVLNASGWTMLLPYLDQEPLYNQYNHSVAAGSYLSGSLAGVLMGDPLVNRRVVSSVIPVFRCPSDDGDIFLVTGGGMFGIAEGSQVRGVKISYDFSADRASFFECNRWTAQAPGGGTPSLSTTRRMFGGNSSCLFRDIKDGASNTVAVMETRFTVFEGVSSAWGYRGWLMFGIDLARNRINQTVTRVDGVNHAPALARFGVAGSLHLGGAHALLADGSVRWLSQAIDDQTRIRLAYMADNQPLGDF